MDKDDLAKLLGAVHDGITLSVFEQLRLMINTLQSTRNEAGRELTTDEIVNMLVMMMDAVIDVMKEKTGAQK